MLHSCWHKTEIGWSLISAVGILARLEKIEGTWWGMIAPSKVHTLSAITSLQEAMKACESCIQERNKVPGVKSL